MSTPAYDKVKLARANKRPTGLDYIQNIFHDFFELHGDRRYRDDGAIVGGVARLGDRPVTVIAVEKGHSAKDRMARSFGAPHPEGYRKALRLMKQAEKFHRPVICFVDTSGAYCGIGAEERGQGQAIAENLMELMTLRVPVLTVVIGEGGSGGALALAVADRVWMLENSVYSVISPEGCASILWKDASKADEAAQCLRLTARDAKGLGVVEAILTEKDLGQRSFYTRLQGRLEREVTALLANENLLEERYQRFRSFGRWQENQKEG
jgi:acetyl-CoA carboxylase carboxyl transferase subunit alpha